MLGLDTFLLRTFFVDIVCSICFALILLMIKIPQSEYSSRLSWTKTYIALCFIACAVVFLFAIYHQNLPDFKLFASMMMLVVTAVSAATLSYSLMNLLDENSVDRDKFFLNVGLVAVLAVLMARSIIAGKSLTRDIFIWVFIAVHLIQCVVHIILFNSVFKKSLKQLEAFYDEEEDHKIRWIRFCYAIMMATEMFVLVYIALPSGAMPIYVLFYALFMLYFTSNFISFLGSHKLLLDAFAHKALSGQDIKLPKRKPRDDNERREEALREDGQAREKEFKALEKNLEKWVATKKYREYDKSRDEIADELHTSKELLQLYFTAKVGEDFRTWRTRLRVEDAKKLLLADKMVSTNYIAELTGFSDRSNFHRQFTKLVGCSPKEWRERAEGKYPDQE